MAKNNQKKTHPNRGCWLTGFLILVMVRNIFAAGLAVVLYRQEVQLALPWLVPTLLILSVADIAAAIGLWNWKRWGLTLYAASTIGAIAVGIILTGTMYIAFYELIPIAILGAIVGTRWSLFE